LCLFKVDNAANKLEDEAAVICLRLA